jgi:D-beta-D-heptose 7-phosphate kinase/D-beta-D-heptose 1-phosphate adenosyltransferase
VGVAGKDEEAAKLERRMEAAGVLADLQIHPTAPTITKLRIISRHQQLIRLDFEDEFAGAEPEDFTARVASHLQGAGALVLSDYGKGALADHQSLIAAARKVGLPVLIDPKGTDFGRYRGATLITPNMSEFEAVVGRCRTESELVERGEWLMRDIELSALLITRSEHGMTLLRPDQRELHLPAQAQEVFDVTGAGDTVISVTAAALAAGEPMPNAVALANVAAGLVVGKLGTASVSGPELRRAVGMSLGLGQGVLTEEQLMIVVEDARAHGEKVAFTNGCFDIIHAGHVGYLEQARGLADKLIVAVNSDESVRRLKGRGRPINPADRRMAVLAALEAVDYVVVFGDDTPERLLEMIKPDVLVKGGDYTSEQVVGAPIVRAYGGDVRVLDFYEKLSTTAIVEQIKGDKDAG